MAEKLFVHIGELRHKMSMSKKVNFVNYYFMCRSLTYAQRTQSVLERNGIRATVTKAPQKISEGGCGYSISVRQSKAERAAEILKRENLLQGKIFIAHPDGEYEEVYF